jgi:hypothetical protein
METNLITGEDRALLLVANKQRTFNVELERQSKK